MSRRLQGHSTARAIVFVLLVAAALAAPSAHAANLPFAATLGFELVGASEITAGGAGVAIVNGSGGGDSLATLDMPALAIQAVGQNLPVNDPQVFPLRGLGLTVANAAGTFMNGQAIIPLMGVAKICLYDPCSATPVTNLSVPLTVVGQGGTVTVMGAVNMTVVGAPWTTGTAALYGHGGTPITRMGSRHGPLSGMTSTAAASGELHLVTPIYISTSLSQQTLFTFARLSLHFVPEPATLGLLGSGIGFLAIAGRRRLRKR